MKLYHLTLPYVVLSVLFDEFSTYLITMLPLMLHYLALSYLVLSYATSPYAILLHPDLSDLILSYRVLSFQVMSYLMLYVILFYLTCTCLILSHMMLPSSLARPCLNPEALLRRRGRPAPAASADPQFPGLGL